MNLKDRDVVNLKMAEIAEAACLLVTDIDRGGVFASLVGTYALLEPQEQARFCGFLINKFRGDVSLFTPGIAYLEERLSQNLLIRKPQKRACSDRKSTRLNSSHT